MKKIVAASLSYLAVLIIIPMTFQTIYRIQTVEGEEVDSILTVSGGGLPKEFKEIVIPVFRSALEEHQELTLEEYVLGVVAAEMPAQFELEALKAQAITARTFALRMLETQDYLWDTTQDQVFYDEGQMRSNWGDNFDRYHARISEAVEATRGLVLEHEGNLIQALFFSTSNGRTENSEDYFPDAVPYLRSVNSEWDRNSTRFEVVTEFSLNDLRRAFNDTTLTVNDFTVLNRTEGGSIREIQVGNQVFTGREVRNKLELRSTDFEIEYADNTVYITTFGFGHGVGMSQTGANEMARMGKTFEDILTHYYQNVNIVEKISLN